MGRIPYVAPDKNDWRARRKANLTLAQFYTATENDVPFALEYLIEGTDEHEINMFIRAPIKDNNNPYMMDPDNLHVINLVAKSEGRDGYTIMPFTQILALRLNARRYNWDPPSKEFDEE